MILLTKKKEKELVKKSKSGCRDAQNKLFNQFRGFTINKVKRYWTSKYEFNEGLSCANEKFITAINYFNPKHNFRFSTFYEIIIRNALTKLKMEKNRQSNAELEYINITKITTPFFKKNNKLTLSLIESNDRNIKDYSEILNSKEIKVLKDKSININQNETAKKLGVSQPMIHKLVKNAEKKIKKFACSPIV